MLVGSCFRSTPQIARILRAGSARGVSILASIAELVAYSITCAYNFRLGAQRSPRTHSPGYGSRPRSVATRRPPWWGIAKKLQQTDLGLSCSFIK